MADEDRGLSPEATEENLPPSEEAQAQLDQEAQEELARFSTEELRGVVRGEVDTILRSALDRHFQGVAHLTDQLKGQIGYLLATQGATKETLDTLQALQEAQVEPELLEQVKTRRDSQKLREMVERERNPRPQPVLSREQTQANQEAFWAKHYQDITEPNIREHLERVGVTDDEYNQKIAPKLSGSIDVLGKGLDEGARLYRQHESAARKAIDAYVDTRKKAERVRAPIDTTRASGGPRLTSAETYRKALREGGKLPTPEEIDASTQEFLRKQAVRS